LVAEEDRFDELLDGGLLVGVEVVEGFEVEAEVGVGGASYVGFEDEWRSAHRRHRPVRRPPPAVRAVPPNVDHRELEVDQDVRGRAPRDLARGLRAPEVADRWYQQLVTMKKSAEAQLAAKSADDKEQRITLTWVAREFPEKQVEMLPGDVP
jgi:hypothetical protein